jgi:hypothetical protein
MHNIKVFQLVCCSIKHSVEDSENQHTISVHSSEHAE